MGSRKGKNMLLKWHSSLNLNYNIRLNIISKPNFAIRILGIAENTGVYGERNETNQSEIVALHVAEKYRAAVSLQKRAQIIVSLNEMHLLVHLIFTELETLQLTASNRFCSL